MISMMMFLSEIAMNDVAQVIFALAFLTLASKSLIWALRCPKDSANYKLPSIQIGSWRESNRDDQES
ncbi:hypothetical protein ATE71_12370 [Sphingopyxis sp. H115]|nr:hypothetical protein ATE71_12370 [Sphingopyxis sp. H115]